MNREDKALLQNHQEGLPNTLSKTGSPTSLDPEYIPAEISLETIGYFTPSSKRIKKILTKEKKIAEKINSDGTKTELRVKIIATGEYGLPNTSDLDYYRAFLKILDEAVEQNGVIPDPIQIPVKKLIRYAGKTVRAGKKEVQIVDKKGKKRTVETNPTFKEVKDWIRRNHYTGIQGFLFNAEKNDYTEIGEEPLFRKYLLRGQKKENGEEAETNYVWLASWFRANYPRYRRIIDLAFHKRLRKPIAKSLYPLLETGWYASGGNPYSKSYYDLCQEFLLQQERYLSDIKQQLNPSHKKLEQERFLAKWEYREAANKSDFIIIYWPGEKFFQDQQARDERRKLAEQINKKTQQLQGRTSTSRRKPTEQENYLLSEILAVCGDAENLAAYHKAIREYSEGLIWMTISETRQAIHEGRIIKTAGAFFMDTLKHLAQSRADAE